MRISDWSSDVCSSDLPGRVISLDPVGVGLRLRRRIDVPRHLVRARLHHTAKLGQRRHHDPEKQDREGDAKPNHLRCEIGKLELRHRIGTLAFERSEEHTSELQSLIRISYAVFYLKKKLTH